MVLYIKAAGTTPDSDLESAQQQVVGHRELNDLRPTDKYRFDLNLGEANSCSITADSLLQIKSLAKKEGFRVSIRGPEISENTLTEISPFPFETIDEKNLFLVVEVPFHSLEIRKVEISKFLSNAAKIVGIENLKWEYPSVEVLSNRPVGSHPVVENFFNQVSDAMEWMTDQIQAHLFPEPQRRERTFDSIFHSVMTRIMPIADSSYNPIYETDKDTGWEDRTKLKGLTFTLPVPSSFLDAEIDDLVAKCISLNDPTIPPIVQGFVLYPLIEQETARKVFFTVVFDKSLQSANDTARQVSDTIDEIETFLYPKS